VGDDLERKVNLIVQGWTLSRRSILRDGPHDQNWLRSSICDIQSQVWNADPAMETSKTLGPPDGRVRTALRDVVAIAEVLRGQISNPVHFGDNQPGMFDDLSRSLLRNPKFTYLDLLQYGVTGPDGFPGFCVECGLPHDTDPVLIEMAIGLLLTDDAVAELDRGNESIAAHMAFQAVECARQATYRRLLTMRRNDLQEELRQRIASAGRSAGIKSGEARRKSAKAPAQEVKVAAKRLIDQGTSERDVAAKLATRFGVSPTYIRRLLKR
jgi:hypothetical protein